MFFFFFFCGRLAPISNKLTIEALLLSVRCPHCTYTRCIFMTLVCIKIARTKTTNPSFMCLMPSVPFMYFRYKLKCDEEFHDRRQTLELREKRLQRKFILTWWWCNDATWNWVFIFVCSWNFEREPLSGVSS